jgi:hypothetical protein
VLARVQPASHPYERILGMPVPQPRHRDPRVRTHACLRSNRKYARPLVRASPAESRARSLAFRSERHCNQRCNCALSENPARVRHQKEETRTSKMQNADLHQRIKLRAPTCFGSRKGGPRDERRSTGCVAEAEVAGVNTGRGGVLRDSRHRRAHLPGVRGNRAPWSEPMQDMRHRPHHRRSRAVIYGTTPSRGRMPRAGPSRRAPETPADTAALVWTSSEEQLKQCPRMKRDSTNRWLIAIAPRGRRAGRPFGRSLIRNPRPFSHR